MSYDRKKNFQCARVLSALQGRQTARSDGAPIPISGADGLGAHAGDQIGSDSCGRKCEPGECAFLDRGECAVCDGARESQRANSPFEISDCGCEPEELEILQF